MSYSAGQKPPNTAQVPYTGDIGSLRKNYRKFLQGQLGGGAENIFTPGGALGSIFQNLFGPGGEGTPDYLGARSALQNVLGGDLSGAYNTAYSQLLPSTLDAIRRGQAGLQESMGPMGLRFSTDLLGQQAGLAGQLLNSAQQNALGAAIPIFQGQQQGVTSLMDMLSKAQQTMSPAALLAQFVQSFPPARGV